MADYRDVPIPSTPLLRSHSRCKYFFFDKNINTLVARSKKPLRQISERGGGGGFLRIVGFARAFRAKGQ